MWDIALCFMASRLEWSCSAAQASSFGVSPFCWVLLPQTSGTGSQWWKSGIRGDFWLLMFKKGMICASWASGNHSIAQKSHWEPSPAWPFLRQLWGSQAEPKIAKKGEVSEIFPSHPFCLIEAEIPSLPAGAFSAYSAQYEIPAQSPPERLLSTVL